MDKTVKFLGFKIYTRLFDDHKYKESFFGGLFTKTLHFKNLFLIYRLFGIKCCRVEFHLGNKYANFKFFRFYTGKSSSFLLQLVASFVRQKFDFDKLDIIALFTKSGETFLLLSHLEKYMQISNISNPVFISTSEYYRYLISMFYPQARFLKVPNIFFELQISPIKKQVLKDGITRYFNFLPHSHFVDLESKLCQGEQKNFVTEVKNTLNLQSPIYKKPTILNNSVNNAILKMHTLSLNAKFIFISPEAKSNLSVSPEFWIKLSKAFLIQGYDVVFNVMANSECNSYGKTCFLQIDEARYVASKAECVIGVRSGFLDVVGNSAKEIHAIYKSFTNRYELKDLESSIVIDAFSLTYLPDMENTKVYEYDAESLKEKEILELVIKRILHKEHKTKL
ncbi:hypothetical protein [Helicobacter sp. 11S02629-2]|uniref:hypothetical protein n=1 Tax=Helicobacter sp. 11S02629-2 TaxID=1476195 RepID=UPI00117AE0A5|nr:hypothetical protein [Helicobacter sp. 11S02629-2]